MTYTPVATVNDTLKTQELYYAVTWPDTCELRTKQAYLVVLSAAIHYIRPRVTWHLHQLSCGLASQLPRQNQLRS